MKDYGPVARRCRDEKDFSFTCWPYAQVPGVGATVAGFFAHRPWPVRVEIEKHSNLRTIYEYNAMYINATGHWLAFVEAAIALRQEPVDATDMAAEALLLDEWAAAGNRYALPVFGLRVHF